MTLHLALALPLLAVTVERRTVTGLCPEGAGTALDTDFFSKQLFGQRVS